MTAADYAAHTERLAFCDTATEVGPDAPTLDDPWRTRDLVAHLIVRERHPIDALGIFSSRFAARTAKAQDKIAAGDYATNVALVRVGPPRWNPTSIPAVDARVNTAEFIVHHEDILRADGQGGPRREVPDAVADGAWVALRQMSSLTMKASPARVTFEGGGRDPIQAGPQEAPPLRIEADPIEALLIAYGRQRVARANYLGDDALIETFKTAKLAV